MGARMGYAMVLVAALMWGSIGVFVNGLSALGISTVSMAAFRLLAGAVLMMPILAVMGLCRRTDADGNSCNPSPLAYFRVDSRALVPCALVGIVGLACANLFYYESMGEVGMSTASVLLYTSPVFGCVLGRALYQERVQANKIAAICLNISGCVLAVTSGDFGAFAFSPYGVAMGVLAGFLGALLAVFSKMATARTHPLTVTFYAFVFGGIVMGALSFPWADMRAALGPELLLWLGGFGLIPTALAYIVYMTGLSSGVEASKVPVVASFETVTTVLIGIALYGESADPIKLAGICLVLASIAVMNLNAQGMRASTLHDRLTEYSAMEVRFFDPEGDLHRTNASGSALMGGTDWQTWVTPR